MILKLFFLDILARELVQCRIPPTVPCRSLNQTPSPRLYNQNPSLDLRSVLQSAAIRLFTDSNVVLHLRHYRDAGKFIRRIVNFSIDSIFSSPFLIFFQSFPLERVSIKIRSRENFHFPLKYIFITQTQRSLEISNSIPTPPFTVKITFKRFSDLCFFFFGKEKTHWPSN